MSRRGREMPVAVILAAGSGVRLGGGLKPLACVAGISLLERSVLAVRDAGIERVIVVIGHEKDTVRRFVAERALDVELVENERFELGNGSSAAIGGLAAGGRRFLLAMVDHVFEPRALARILTLDAPFVAAVDTNARYCDVAEATKVRLDRGRVVAVDRELDPYDAVDAGLFLCDAEVAVEAERALAAGACSWNAVKRRWLDEGREIAAVDLEGAFWIDVDTPSEARRAERLLVRRAAGKPLDGVVSRRLNRKLSWPVSLALLRLGVSPNAATVLSFLVSLAAATSLACGRFWTAALVAGGLLVQASSIVDGTDGEIARATLRSSPAGRFLDSVLDRLGDAAVLGGLAFAAGPGTVEWAALVAAVFGSLQAPYVKASFEASFARSFPASVYRLGIARDVRLLLVAGFAVALQPGWGLVAAAVLANAEVARRFAGGWRAARAAPSEVVTAAAVLAQRRGAERADDGRADGDTEHVIADAAAVESLEPLHRRAQGSRHGQGASEKKPAPVEGDQPEGDRERA